MQKPLSIIVQILLLSFTLNCSSGASISLNSLANTPQEEVSLYSYTHYYPIRTYIDNLAASDPVFVYSMIFALYTSLTVIPNNCSRFQYYPDFCESFICTNLSQSSQTASLPYFEVTGPTASLNIDLNQNISFNSSSIIASSCTIESGSMYGKYNLGIIGTGTSGMDPANPSIFSYFSVYLSSSYLDSSLMFYFDPSKAQSSNPVAILKSTGDWQVNDITTIYIGDNALDVSNISLAFDLNAQGMFLPRQIYDFISSSLDANFGCYDEQYQDYDNTSAISDDNVYPDTYNYLNAVHLVCEDQISALPTINISTMTQNITIPPEVYVQAGSFSSFIAVFNLMTTDPNNISLYTITPVYQNTIILGSSFMRYFYTLFDARNGNNTISLYLANQNPIVAASSSSEPLPDTTSSGSSNVAVILLAIAVGVLLICCVIMSYWVHILKGRVLKAKEKHAAQIGLVSLGSTTVI